MAQSQDIRTQVLRNIIRRYQPKTHRDPSDRVPQSQLEQKLPPELIAIVLIFLPVPDQICFALSCKYLLACLSSCLKIKGTSLRQLLPRSIISPHHLKESREQLLTQLENEHWELCECHILHPRFYPVQFGLTKEQHKIERSHVCSKLPINLNLVPNIKFDLCPCITITHRERRHLIGTYKTAVRSGKTHTGCEYYYNGALSYSYADQIDSIHQYIRHTCDCEYLRHPLAKVRIHTALRSMQSSRNRHVDKLVIVNSYEITMTSRTGQQLCPRLSQGNLSLWLPWFFARAGWSFHGYDTVQVLYFQVQSYWDKTAKDPCRFKLDFSREFEGSVTLDWGLI